MTNAAIPGRDFLKGRGFDKAAADHFEIGFAPKGWNGLFDHLTALGFTMDELLAAALVTKSERGAYDKFRGRLIWPIKDTTGQVIGFGARKLFDDDNGPKYLNTSDTLVYHKSQVLYGIDLAKKIRQSNPGIGIVLLTAFLNPTQIEEKILQLPPGSKYLVKHSVTKIETLVNVINEAARFQAS